MDTNVLEGAQINEWFVTEGGERMTFIREVETNGEYRYMMRGENGDRVYYNAAGRTPLNYDPARYIRQKYEEPKFVYAEIPVFKRRIPPWLVAEPVAYGDYLVTDVDTGKWRRVRNGESAETAVVDIHANGSISVVSPYPAA